MLECLQEHPAGASYLEQYGMYLLFRQANIFDKSCSWWVYGMMNSCWYIVRPQVVEETRIVCPRSSSDILASLVPEMRAE